MVAILSRPQWVYKEDQDTLWGDLLLIVAYDVTMVIRTIDKEHELPGIRCTYCKS